MDSRRLRLIDDENATVETRAEALCAAAPSPLTSDELLARLPVIEGVDPDDVLTLALLAADVTSDARDLQARVESILGSSRRARVAIRALVAAGFANEHEQGGITVSLTGASMCVHHGMPVAGIPAG